MATEIVGSKMPADDGYGQNGYKGASSECPDKCTTTGFLPQVTLPEGDGVQTRDVGTSNVQPSFGMKRQTDPSIIK
jgi:hypothetical protein